MSLSQHLRRISDGPLDAIDAQYLMDAAEQIERLDRALNSTAEKLKLVMKAVGCYDQATIDAALRDFRSVKPKEQSDGPSSGD